MLLELAASVQDRHSRRQHVPAPSINHTSIYVPFAISYIQTGTILYQKLIHVRRGDGEKGVPQKVLYKFRVPSLKKD